MNHPTCPMFDVTRIIKKFSHKCCNARLTARRNCLVFYIKIHSASVLAPISVGFPRNKKNIERPWRLRKGEEEEVGKSGFDIAGHSIACTTNQPTL